ncbi:MAG: HD domain-containing protein [Anaerolineales bacterium]|nr:HD domain-containing protein [Anaerolineales bacterium]
MITDMTLQNLPDSDQRLEAIFQAFGDLLFILHEDGTILDYRSGDKTYLYLSPSQFLGRKIQEIYPYKVGRKYMDAIFSVRSDKKIVLMEYSLPMPFGEGWFEARLVPIANGQVIACIRNITKHKQSEVKIERQLQQLAALRAIDLAITTNSDLSTTLSAILDHVRAQLKIDAASISLLNPRSHMLEHASGVGFYTTALEHIPLPIGAGYAGKAVLENKVMHVSDLLSRQTDFLRSPYFGAENFIDYYAVPLFVKGNPLGVMEIFHRSVLSPDMEWLSFLETLAGQAAIAIDSAILFRELQQSNGELTLAYEKTIEGWSRALDLRDTETENHTRRVTEMCLRLAARLNIPADEMIHIHRGGVLHDIGKVAIPDSILFKHGPLTEEEWKIMRRHPSIAVELLEPISYLAPAMDIPRSHHEKWDGSGYPDGLAGDAIPLAARIFALADVYDALTSDRPYRSAWSKANALEYVNQNSGIHFDPNIASEFISMVTA